MPTTLNTLASYIEKMLMSMTKEKAHMHGVSGDIDKMSDKLRDLKVFLADADKRSITDLSVQPWVRDLRGAMYDAADILDLCQLKAMERGLNTDIGRSNIGSRIKKLNQRLDDINARKTSFNFINLEYYEDARRNVVSALHDARQTSGVVDESGLVGEKIEEDMRNIVEMLTTEERTQEAYNQIKVFAIMGIGGIGKTTLAEKIFSNDIIQHKFTKKIWLSVNRDFNETDILKRVISGAAGIHPAYETRKDIDILYGILMGVLKGHKTLLIMDDVWDCQAWEGVLKTPFVRAGIAQGSRVLITTRHDTVARGMMAEKPYHHVDKLEPEDAWLLLKKQVVGNVHEERQLEMLKDIGMAIIEKCDYLPLAVKVIGGLLRQKLIQRGIWERVLNDSIWSISSMPNELNYAIYLSYEDLHPGLKSCFLHYSLLPKSTVFFVHEIVGMWISEGFIHETSGDLEETGKYYYDELRQRNLIEPNMRFTDRCVCTMHDVVRSFAQYVARDEALVARSSEPHIFGNPYSQKIIRLSLHTEGFESNELQWCSLQAQVSLRTIISVGHIQINPGDSLVSFPHIRTLHVQDAKFDTLVASLDKLKHLRYLSIHFTNTSKLPEHIGSMKFLQHISLNGCTSMSNLPVSITKLQQLRSLSLAGTSIKYIPKGFGGLTNLRQLIVFPAHMDGDRCSLEELGPLSQLRVLEISGLENVSSSSFAKKARLGDKEHLSYLQLACTTSIGGDDQLVIGEECIAENKQRQIEEVFDMLRPPPSLENLGIKGYYGRRIPEWMMSTTAMLLPNLRIVSMHDLVCCRELPSFLYQLPWLELLQIDGAPMIKRVGLEFLHPNHRCHNHYQGGAFSGLRRLNFIGMVELEQWEWEQHVKAMPFLEVLQLEKCKLRRLPPGLAFHASALRKLCVHNVGNLSSVQNLSSVIELHVLQSPDLETISNLSKLQDLKIEECPKMKVLTGVPALYRLKLEDYDMETLPRYLQHVKPTHLMLGCSILLLLSVAVGKSSIEWDKFNHIKQVKAHITVMYPDHGGIPRDLYVLYTRDPFNFQTNISSSKISLACLRRTQLAYLATCSIEDGSPLRRGAHEAKLLPLCLRFRWHAYTHLVHWLHRVCRHCNEAIRTASSSDQWVEAAGFPASNVCRIR
ncbi:unnamed protein product [Urochloa decumbens]|uniref:Uncharacterized protein n=1 Tax=Urochloa decumbens TaxID=240449 RepID=A0ABC9B5B6_9POAL